MKAYTNWDRFLDFIYRDRLNKFRYSIAKKWLDNNFGEHKYWGEEISKWKSTYESLTISRKN